MSVVVMVASVAFRAQQPAKGIPRRAACRLRQASGAPVARTMSSRRAKRIVARRDAERRAAATRRAVAACPPRALARSAKLRVLHARRKAPRVWVPPNPQPRLQSVTGEPVVRRSASSAANPSAGYARSEAPARARMHYVRACDAGCLFELVPSSMPGGWARPAANASNASPRGSLRRRQKQLNAPCGQFTRRPGGRPLARSPFSDRASSARSGRVRGGDHPSRRSSFHLASPGAFRLRGTRRRGIAAITDAVSAPRAPPNPSRRRSA